MSTLWLHFHIHSTWHESMLLHTHRQTHTHTIHTHTMHAIQMHTPCKPMPSKHTHTRANTQILFTTTHTIHIQQEHKHTMQIIHYVHRDIHQAHTKSFTHKHRHNMYTDMMHTDSLCAHKHTHHAKTQITNIPYTHNAYALKHTSHAHTYNLYINNNLKNR